MMPLIERRAALGLLGAGLTLAAAPRLATAAPRLIPEQVRTRVIVDNDYSGDPDGLVAVLASAYGGSDRYRRGEPNPRADRALAIELKGVL